MFALESNLKYNYHSGLKLDSPERLNISLKTLKKNNNIQERKVLCSCTFKFRALVKLLDANIAYYTGIFFIPILTFCSNMCFYIAAFFYQFALAIKYNNKHK